MKQIIIVGVEVIVRRPHFMHEEEDDLHVGGHPEKTLASTLRPSFLKLDWRQKCVRQVLFGVVWGLVC